MAQARPSRPIPLAKLTWPRLPAVLLRPRLFRLLDRARRQPVVWITAPPGYGKSTLVASYLKTRKLKTLWYQVDEGDADVATFFHYLGLAAQQAAPRHTRPLPNLTPEYLLGLPTFTRNFFNDLCKRLKCSAVLVLDNYQLVPADSKLHEVLQWAIEALQPGMRLIVLSRAGPPTALARSQANQMIEVVAKEALQLTDSETKAVVRLHRPAAEKVVVQKLLPILQQKFNGWIAGVVLLVRQVTTQRALEALSRGQTPEVVFDYLAREVLHTLPQDEQTFLITSALLPKMTTHMAEQLTGFHQGGAVLTRLARAHYFTEQRFEQVPMFEYHPLFREFLLSHLSKTWSSEQFMQLRRHAGTLLEEAGHLEDAVALFRESGEHGELVRLILTHAPSLIAQGRLQTVEDWITALPPRVVEATPWLLFWLGSCRMPFNPVESQSCFERAFAAFEKQSDHTGTLLAWCGVVQSIWFAWQDLSQLDLWIERFSTIHPADAPYPSPAIEQQVLSAMIHASMMRRPQAEWIGLWVERAEAAVRRDDGDVNARLLLGNVVIQYLVVWKAEFDAAARMLSVLSESVRAEQPSPFAQSAFYLAQATYLWQTGQVEEAFESIKTGLAICESTGALLYLPSFLGYGVYIYRAAGRPNDAESLFARYEGLVLNSAAVTLKGFYHSQAGWRALLQGRTRDAWHHVQVGVAVADRHEGPFAQVQQVIGAAQVCHEMGATQEARRFVSQAQSYSQLLPNHYFRWPLLLTQSLIEWEIGECAIAVETLRMAMEFGRTKRMFDTMWWRPDMMAKLCALALEHGIEIEYVAWLIKVRSLSPPMNGMSTEAWPWPIKIRTLGRFAVEFDGRPVTFGRKTPKKPLELLKAIVAWGGQEIHETSLSDALWPEADGDAAHEAFAKTLQRLRRLLGHDDAIQLRDGKITLNRQNCWVDVLAFEDLLQSTGSAKSDSKQNGWVIPHQKAIALYRGSFLANEDLVQWAQDCRTRLQRRYARAIKRLMDHYRRFNEGDQAEQCLSLVAAAEPDLVASLLP